MSKLFYTDKIENIVLNDKFIKYDDVRHKELKMLLKRVIKKLTSKRQQKIMQEYYFGNIKTQTALAKKLKISYASVKTYKVRAIKILKKKIAKELNTLQKSKYFDLIC